MAEAGIQFRPRTAATPPAPVGGARSLLAVEGMTCGNCARHVTDALQGVDGVAFAAVDLARGRATVHWKPAATPHADPLVQAVSAAGYQARLAQPDGKDPAVESGDSVARTAAASPNPWRWPLWLGVPATVLLLTLDWGFGLGMNRGYHWFAFLVALPVQIVAGAGFYRGAWNQFRARSANMDTLVSLGSTAAFGFSVWALFSRAVPHLFFPEAVTILTLISLGHWLESRMSEQAGAALRALLELAPARARKLVPDPKRPSAAGVDGIPASMVEVDVPAATLVPGDLILLKPGDRVPVDALVMEGTSSYDESMLTGESLPVEKSLGNRVLAGTLNASARQVASVVAIGEETALASIIAAVQRAQSSRANIQRLADRISAVFVPVVIVIAMLAAAAWLVAPESARAVQSALGGMLWHVHLPESPLAAAFFVLCSVLIVACPCAMGIATPVALMAGVNAAARRGILIRDAQALEKSGIVTAVLFDKTGTLTEGRPTVSNSEVLGTAADSKEILGTAAAVGAASQHPLSRAISQVDGSGARVTGAEEARGGGVRAMAAAGFCGRLQPVRVRLGSLRWLEEEGVALPSPNRFADTALERGMTTVGFAVDRELRAQFALQDKLRPDAASLVAQLRSAPLGFQVHLVSGDHPRVVDAVARDLGFDGAFAGVRPTEKAARIQELQGRGLRVAFVGDGINDAPALAQADLGIAVAQASDAAREAADILLLSSGLRGVRTALLLARATLQTIRQNLFWAFFYNAVAVPLAAFGMLSPVVCALSMGLSDVIVIGNALRLARKKV